MEAGQERTGKEEAEKWKQGRKSREKGADMEEKYESMTDEELIDSLREGEAPIMVISAINIRIWCGGKQSPCLFWGQTRRI